MLFNKLRNLLALSALVSLTSLAVPLEGGHELAVRQGVTVGGTHSGDGTNFAPGLGACGRTNTANDLIVSIGHNLFDNYPGHTANPNNNPVCGRTLTAHYQGKSVTVTVVDRCGDCNTYDLDFSPAAFEKLAPLSAGRIHGVTWAFN